MTKWKSDILLNGIPGGGADMKLVVNRLNIVERLMEQQEIQKIQLRERYTNLFKNFHGKQKSEGQAEIKQFLPGSTSLDF